MGSTLGGPWQDSNLAQAVAKGSHVLGMQLGQIALNWVLMGCVAIINKTQRTRTMRPLVPAVFL